MSPSINRSVFGALAAAATLAMVLPAIADEAAPTWTKDWAVADGVSLTRDTTGYSLPSAIAFVPDPGPAPADPLYFVTELGGTVKVVARAKR